MAPLTLFEEPAPPPLIVEPVALMRLGQLEEIEELDAAMRRYDLGPADIFCETKLNKRKGRMLRGTRPFREEGVKGQLKYSRIA